MGFAGPTRVFCMCLLLAALLLCSAPISSTLPVVSLNWVMQNLNFVENGGMGSELGPEPEPGRRCLKADIDDYSDPGANPGHDPTNPPT